VRERRASRREGAASVSSRGSGERLVVRERRASRREGGWLSVLSVSVVFVRRGVVEGGSAVVRERRRQGGAVSPSMGCGVVAVDGVRRRRRRWGASGGAGRCGMMSSEATKSQQKQANGTIG
jgi:hypothetical protein